MCASIGKYQNMQDMRQDQFSWYLTEKISDVTCATRAKPGNMGMALGIVGYGEHHPANKCLSCVPKERTWECEEENGMSVCLMDPPGKAGTGTI